MLFFSFLFYLDYASGILMWLKCKYVLLILNSGLTDQLSIPDWMSNVIGDSICLVVFLHIHWTHRSVDEHVPVAVKTYSKKTIKSNILIKQIITVM